MSKISLKHSGGNVVSLNSPTNAPGAADVAFKLPNTDGSNGQAIVTDGSGNLSFGSVAATRNLIINGAMQVAQRGTSSTSTGYQTVDRFYGDFSGTDEAPTFAQVDVASGTTPYTSGFRKALKITNGNQTSGAGTADKILIYQRIEAQNLAQSGWNYTSSSSNVTLSFWVKSSVAQNFYGYLRAPDGTSQNYPFETGSLSADTWTKITKTISGNSNLTIDNNNNIGLEFNIVPFWGTDNTGSVSLNAWAAFNASVRMPNNTSTWYTTNDATFEITGVQLEVGSTATDFEHRSFAQELTLCQRYFFRIGDGSNAYQIQGNGFIGVNGGTKCAKIIINPPVPMRTTPTLSVIGTDSFRATAGTSTMTCTATANTGGIWNDASNGDIIWLDLGRSGSDDPTAGDGCVVYADNNSANLSFVAEL